MSHYSYHQYYNRVSVLKRDFDKEYQQLIDKYGKENIELEKELTFAYWYRCWVNEAEGEWTFDPLIDEYVYVSDEKEDEFDY